MGTYLSVIWPVISTTYAILARALTWCPSPGRARPFNFILLAHFLDALASFAADDLCSYCATSFVFISADRWPRFLCTVTALRWNSAATMARRTETFIYTTRNADSPLEKPGDSDGDDDNNLAITMESLLLLHSFTSHTGGTFSRTFCRFVRAKDVKFLALLFLFLQIELLEALGWWRGQCSNTTALQRSSLSHLDIAD